MTRTSLWLNGQQEDMTAESGSLVEGWEEQRMNRYLRRLLRAEGPGEQDKEIMRMARVSRGVKGYR